MKADFSIPNIKNKFKKFNSLFFEGLLTEPDFIIKLTKNQLGQCKIKRNARPIISLSSYYEVEEIDLELTLIHEMIHLYQYQILNERMNHRDSFKRKAYIISQINPQYNITRCSSRYNYELSTEGKIKADRQKLSTKNPIIMICNEIINGKQYAWFVRLSDKLYNSIFFDKFLSKRYSNLNVMGFIYNKPNNWICNTATCRKRLSGKRFEWDKFLNLYQKDVIFNLVLHHSINKTIIFNES